MYFRKILNTVKNLFAVLMVVLVIGFLIPQKVIMPVMVPKDAVTMKVITYRGDKQMGRLVVFPIAEMKKRAGVKDKM